MSGKMAVIDRASVRESCRPQVFPHCTLVELRTRQIERPREVVRGPISEGETVLIVGRPKTGKSRLTLQLARDLSRGEPFLGHAIPQPRRVLMIDLENRHAVVRERFLKMAPEPIDSDENISIYAAETLSSDPVGLDGDGFENLITLIEKTNPDVIVFDTWRLLIGASGENKAEAVVRGLRRLSDLRKDRPQLVTIIVHRLRKQNSDQKTILRNDPYDWVENLSGHHALIGHVDACYGIERESSTNGDELIVFGGVARNAASTCTLLDEDEETLNVSGAYASPLPDMPLLTAHREMPSLRMHRVPDGGSMRLTLRDMQILRLLRTARWLTTSQVRARFFSHATCDAVRKRLRKLTQEKYLVMVRRDHKSHALFALGPHEKAVLEDESTEPLILERRPPARFDYFMGVNDCRVSAELARCTYFFACWELPRIHWRHKLIPDAIFSLQDQTFALEFDRGFEGAQFFAKTQRSHLEQGFPDLPDCRVLMITESAVRMKALAIGPARVEILFIMIELIRTRGLFASILCRQPREECEPESLLSPSLDAKRVLGVQQLGYQQLEVSRTGPIKEDRT